MTMMQCGHAANAKDEHGHPMCVICAGIKPGAYEPDLTPPSLEGREAQCMTCGRRAPSTPGKMAFFKHRPDQEFDSYYDGCRGWD